MPWRKTETGVLHFVCTKDGLWSEVAAQETGENPEFLDELRQLGSIYLNDRRMLEPHQVHCEDYLRIHTQPRRYPQAQKISLIDRVVFEDQNLLILDKPSGLPCHPTVDNIKENLLHLFWQQTGQTILITHRLDVATSGLLVFAKNLEAQNLFHACLQNRKIKKVYQALVKNPGPAVGLYQHHMLKTEWAPKSVTDKAGPETQECLMKVLKSEPFGDVTRLEIELLTGRTHQIRAQLSFMGFPILDDQLYLTGSNRHPDERISLRCVELSFPWMDSVISLRISDLENLSLNPTPHSIEPLICI